MLSVLSNYISNNQVRGHSTGSGQSGHVEWNNIPGDKNKQTNSGVQVYLRAEASITSGKKKATIKSETSIMERPLRHAFDSTVDAHPIVPRLLVRLVSTGSTSLIREQRSKRNSSSSHGAMPWPMNNPMHSCEGKYLQNKNGIPTSGIIGE